MLTVSFTVKNTGAVAGQEIVQLYVRDVDTTVFRPEKELKGFAKVDLAPGVETTVSIELGRRAFAYYATSVNDWQVETGVFDILVGASAQDIRLQGHMTVTAAESAASADGTVPVVYHQFPKGEPISQATFARLLGAAIPANEQDTQGSYSINTPFEDMRDTFIGFPYF